MATITGLFIYPIKSCQGIALTQSPVTRKGLAWDREFMLVDGEGQFLTQRQYPQMATIAVALQNHQLHLSSPHQEPLCLTPQDTGQTLTIKVWRDQGIAIDQGELVAHWFQQALQLDHPVRLVRQSPHHPRLIDSNYRPHPDAAVSFADGFPVLVTNTASLAALNRRITTKGHRPVPMARFRPNVVVDTDQAFVESTWQTLHTPNLQLTLVKPCSRCVVTTTDQKTGDRRGGEGLQEPLATLREFRHVPKQGILFGENGVPEEPGHLAVGESVTIVPRQA